MILSGQGKAGSAFDCHTCPPDTFASRDFYNCVFMEELSGGLRTLRSFSAPTHILEIILAFNTQQFFLNHGHQWPQISHAGRIYKEET